MFSKNSEEWRSNGHYIINEMHFMSIWKFKNCVLDDYNRKKTGNSKTTHIFTFSNTNEINYKEAEKITKRFPEIIAFESKPDLGKFDSVLIFPVHNLLDFYNTPEDVEFRIHDK